MSALFKWHSRPQPEDGALGKVEARLDLTIEESEEGAGLPPLSTVATAPRRAARPSRAASSSAAGQYAESSGSELDSELLESD